MKKYVYYNENGEIKSISDIEISVKGCEFITTTRDFEPSKYNVVNKKLTKLREELQTVEARKTITEEEVFLNSSDYKVTRQRDQLDLGVETSMTEDEFRALLEARQNARENIAGGK